MNEPEYTSTVDAGFESPMCETTETPTVTDLDISALFEVLAQKIQAGDYSEDARTKSLRKLKVAEDALLPADG